MRLKKHPIGPLLLVYAAMPSAYGGVQVYRGEIERDHWFADAGGEVNVTTIGFSEFPNNTTLTDQYRDLGVTFEGLNFVSGPVPVNYQDEWGLRIISGNFLHFEEPINWIAADILGHVVFELYDGDTLLFQSDILGVQPDTGFGGLISEAAFNRVRIYDPLDPFAVLDDLHFGPPINVPAPGALLLFGSAALGKRRRRH